MNATNQFSIPTTLDHLQAGWYDDPYGHHVLRWWDGSAWTDHAVHAGPVPCPGGCRH